MLVTTAVLKNKISKAEIKIPDVSGLVTSAVLNTKMEEVENQLLLVLSKKQIITIKYQTLIKSILILLIIIILRLKYLMKIYQVF